MDFLQLPPGVDWSAVFGDIVTLISPLVLLSLAFGAYHIVKRILKG